MLRAPAAARLAARRTQLAELDTSLTTACERAAGQGRPHHLAPADPAAWNAAICRRYLREAQTQDYLLGPRMRRLKSEIGRLEARLPPGHGPTRRVMAPANAASA